MDELINMEKLQSNFAHWDLKELQAEIVFVLKELWNQCEKRVSMNEAIKLQNELVAILANSSVTILDLKPAALVHGEVLSQGGETETSAASARGMTGSPGSSCGGMFETPAATSGGTSGVPVAVSGGGTSGASNSGIDGTLPSPLCEIEKFFFTFSQRSIRIKNKTDFTFYVTLTYSLNVQEEIKRAGGLTGKLGKIALVDKGAEMGVSVSHEFSYNHNAPTVVKSEGLLVNPHTVLHRKSPKGFEGALATLENNNNRSQFWLENAFIPIQHELVVRGKPSFRVNGQHDQNIHIKNETTKKNHIIYQQSYSTTTDNTASQVFLAPGNDISCDICLPYTGAIFTVKELNGSTYWCIDKYFANGNRISVVGDGFEVKVEETEKRGAWDLILLLFFFLVKIAVLLYFSWFLWYRKRRGT